MHLREGSPFPLYAHARVHAALDRNPLFEVLDRKLVPRRQLEPERDHDLVDGEGGHLGIAVRPFVVPGKVPLYLEGETDRLDTAAQAGDALGLEIRPSGGDGPQWSIWRTAR